MDTDIGFYLPSFHIGGAERVVINLANGFTDRGYSVDLLVGTNEGKLNRNINNNVNVVQTEHISFPPYDALGEVPFLRRYLREEQPRNFYSAMNHVNIAVLFANRLASTTTNMIISEHNDPRLLWENSLKDRTVYRIGRFLYPSADEIIAVSKGVSDNLIDIVGVGPENISTIYNPIVTDDIFDKASEPTDHEWFYSDDYEVILSVGRLHKQKRFQDLIRAFGKYDLPDQARLVIIGSGEERERLEEEIQRWDVTEKVAIINYVENIYSYMNDASVFVLSSGWEGFGNVIVEALACGCPVVSTNCPSGPAEILCDGQYGKLVSVGDPEELAKAIRDTLIQGINQSCLRNRSIDFHVEEIMDKYENVIRV